MSNITESLCKDPQGGNITLGFACNINRKTQASDIHTWIKLMQVWGKLNTNMPHVSLPESRLKAHCDLQYCINELEIKSKSLK